MSATQEEFDKLQDAWFAKHGQEVCEITLVADWFVRCSFQTDAKIHNRYVGMLGEMLALYCESRGITEESFYIALGELRRNIETMDIISKIPD